VALDRAAGEWLAAEPDATAAFRRTMADFAAGVTIVTTTWQGMAHAMTATAFCSVSLNPPLVLVCVSKASRFHQAVLATDGWAVSFLSHGQEGLARHFANRGRDLATQFDSVPHTSATLTAAPLIDGALAWLECATYGRHDGGDHTILVGQVLRTIERAGGRQPLTYYQGTYSSDPGT
jgi:flavin reductase (DIM6/NTAB) family NADH-FMN oxidoreductase RutF